MTPQSCSTECGKLGAVDEHQVGVHPLRIIDGLRAETGRGDEDPAACRAPGNAPTKAGMSGRPTWLSVYRLACTYTTSSP